MILSGIRLYESAQTRMDRERKIMDNATFEVSKRLSLRFPHRDIEESEIEFCGIQITSIKNEYPSSLKTNLVYGKVFQNSYTAKFMYKGNYYNLHTKDTLHFESDELKINCYHLPETLKKLQEKLEFTLSKKIDLKDVIIESYDEKDVPTKNSTVYDPQTETLYFFIVLYENKTYKICFDKNNKTRRF